jgi:hypothetical protein
VVIVHGRLESHPERHVLQQLARYRCRHDEYRRPLEMAFAHWPAEKPS